MWMIGLCGVRKINALVYLYRYIAERLQISFLLSVAKHNRGRVEWGFRGS